MREAWTKTGQERIMPRLTALAAYGTTPKQEALDGRVGEVRAWRTPWPATRRHGGAQGER
jgi:hypothetical protein